MLVIFKNEEGAYSVRPAFIGFIKNDIARRTLGVIFYPFVIIATILINIIQAARCTCHCLACCYIAYIYNHLGHVTLTNKGKIK